MPKYDQHIIENLYERVLYPAPVIEEAYMTVPEKVYRHIKDYYIESFRKIKLEGIKRIGSKNFPIKNFPLDFSGTQYEHLNKMSPKANVDVKLSLGRQSHYSDRYIHDHKGFVQLDFSDFSRGVFELIEHEVSHLVQYMTRQYNKEYKKIPKSIIGGLPSKKIIPQKVKDKGIMTAGKVEHSKDPVEYYPDLTSSVRNLQNQFYKKYHEMDNWKEIKESERYKKEYFMKFYDAVKKGEHFAPIASEVFKSFKEISKPFYLKMVALAYDAFVNKPWNFDPDEIKTALRDIGIELAKKTAEKENKKEDKPDAIRFSYTHDLRIDGYDRSDILGDLEEKGLEVYDGNSESAMTVFDRLEIREREDSRNGGSIYNLPLNPRNIANLFVTLRDLKDANKDIFSFLIWDEKTGKPRDLAENEIPSIYDSIYEEIRKRYIGAADENSKENIKKLIDISYG